MRQTTIRFAPALLVGVLSFATTSHASGALPSASAKCAKLFGSESARANNEARRQSTLHEVKSRQGKIELIHSVPKWDDPQPTRLSGIALRGRTESGGVKVVVDDSFGEMCPPGEYELRVDDAIGADGHVLAVLPSALLIEREKNLSYIPVDDRRAPINPAFRMVWRSHYVWVSQQTKGGALAPSTTTAARGTSEPMAADERKKRNDDARRRAKERRAARQQEQKSAPQNIVDSLPTTQLAKELGRPGKPAPKSVK